MGAMGSGTFAPRHSVANIVIGKDSNEKTSPNLCNSQIFSLPLPAIVKTKINF
jgi:hypothetical protein